VAGAIAHLGYNNFTNGQSTPCQISRTLGFSNNFLFGLSAVGCFGHGALGLSLKLKSAINPWCEVYNTSQK
jgi:hypothetical protein